MDAPLYFRRCTESIVDKAHALETITTEQYVKILAFYNEDVFMIHGQDGMETLRSIIPRIEQKDYDAEKDMYLLKVLEWPHLKVMCLKCAPSNPCIWKYFDEEDHELFEYRIDTCSILCPATPLLEDFTNPLAHGTD